MRYSHFTEKSMREEVLDIGNNLAEYMYTYGIQNIILMDRSARPAYLALKNSWRKNYPEAKCPNIYFTNPKGYNLFEKSIDKLATEFNNTYVKLAEDKNASIMLFDVCMHDGHTLSPVIETVRKAGYNNLFVGLAQPPHRRRSLVHLDFIAINHSLAGVCYPFMRDYIVSKLHENILSTPDSSEFHESFILRKEMNAIFRGNVYSDCYQ